MAERKRGTPRDLLLRRIMNKMSELKLDGTTGMSLENLYQLITMHDLDIPRGMCWGVFNVVAETAAIKSKFTILTECNVEYVA